MAISWREMHIFSLWYAILTYGGVICAHASIDLLNDYHDYKKSIDLFTVRTPLSGGTGVLPEGLLEPRSVHRSGLLLLACGTLIGLLLTILRGWIVGLFLLVGVISVYFYSIYTANIGLGEVSLVVKGTLVVLGTYYVQTLSIALTPLFVGLIMGLLSSSALYVNEFADYEADRKFGRRNLIVRLSPRTAAKMYMLYPVLIYAMILTGISAGIIPLIAVVTLIAILLFRRTLQSLSRARFEEPPSLIPAMTQNIVATRIVGVVIALSYLIAS